MFTLLMRFHGGLATARRAVLLASGDRPVGLMEIGVLILLGIGAAVLTATGELRLQLPGHNIIRVIFPLAMGLALVPRRGSATLVGLGGLGAAAVLMPLVPRGLGLGAVTGMALMGPFVDLALARANSGRAIYLRLALAGLAANLAAFAVRGGARMVGWGFAGHVSAAWWHKAPITYPLFGLLAGLISAAVWFRATAKERDAAVDNDLKP
jgi:hypothetical protein